MKRLLAGIGMAIAGISLWVSVSEAAPTLEQRCRSAKLNAIGKFQACVAKKNARAVLSGGVADISMCKALVEKALASADSHGECVSVPSLTPQFVEDTIIFNSSVTNSILEGGNNPLFLNSAAVCSVL